MKQKYDNAGKIRLGGFEVFKCIYGVPFVIWLGWMDETNWWPDSIEIQVSYYSIND